MTTHKKKPTPKPINSSTGFSKQKAVNDNGLPSVVLLPVGESDASKGIPVSLDLSPLYGDAPIEFQRALYAALHARGLVEAADFLKPQAAELFRSAMLSVIKHDFFSVQTLAKEELRHA